MAPEQKPGTEKNPGEKGGCGTANKEGPCLSTTDEAIRPLTRVEKEVVKTECLRFPGTTVTVCCLTMRNGYYVIGTSACVDPAGYNQQLGMDLAIQDAKDKAEPLVAYLWKEERYRDQMKIKDGLKKELLGELAPRDGSHTIQVQQTSSEDIKKRIEALRKKLEENKAGSQVIRDRSMEQVVDIGSQRYTRIFSLDDHSFDAHHLYVVRDADTGQNMVEINFQLGPIKEHGVNGIHHEDLIAICLDRLQHLNRGRFTCRQNALAITKLEEALLWLRDRTREREKRGVEGTSSL